MHQVIKNILARKNKKVPVNDGRKIGLCLYGGFMTGIRGAGAMIAFEEMGLSYVFDEIYTYSAGFPNASYMLSGETRKGTSIYYDDFSGRKFINFRRFWKIADTDYLVKVMKERKILDIGKILTSSTKLYSRLLNVKTNKSEYLEIHSVGRDNYFKVMKAATSASIVTPGGGVEINGKFYRHVGVFGNNWEGHINNVLFTDLTDILVIYCYSDQSRVNFKRSERVFEITPEQDWQMSRFETRSEVLRGEARKMGRLVKSIFGDNSEIEIEYKK